MKTKLTRRGKHPPLSWDNNVAYTSKGFGTGYEHRRFFARVQREGSLYVVATRDFQTTGVEFATHAEATSFINALWALDSTD